MAVTFPSDSHDGDPSGAEHTAAAYDAVSAVYIDLFGKPELAHPEDHQLIRSWASSTSGTVLDAGCGPGHWSSVLRAVGLEVVGVDLSASFLEHARRSHSGIPFLRADVRRLPFRDSGLAGVLAWYSLIHLDEQGVRDALREFRRVLCPGGRVLLGFFSADDGDDDDAVVRPFGHRVAPALAWSRPWLQAELQRAGFTVTAWHARDAEGGHRAHGAVEAVRAEAPQRG